MSKEKEMSKKDTNENVLKALEAMEKERKRNKSSLISFFAGLLMLSAGLFMIFQNLSIYSSWGMSSIFHIGSYGLPNGLIMLPLILSIAMLFIMERKIFGWIVFAIGIVIILAAVLMSVQIHWRTTNGYVFVCMFGLAAAGGAMVLRELFRS